jgi:EAL domain-containing protein (putative c-di-GMP-specific phosphodiesterase class I)/DNA-binding CsgD family transcriptional regulator
MRMLVFDDDAAVGRLVTRVATLTGLEATSVTEPEAFRQSLTDAPPQVILLDLQLGVTDGVEQLRYLAEQHYGGAIVVMSGFDARVLAATATVAKNLELNIAATLAKPIRVAELEEVIERLKSVRQPISGDELLAAIRDNELSLEFQPIVSWRPRTLNKLEALVRWDHPEFGQISPADFLPLAETNRATIDALTDWVIGAAVEAWGVLRELDVNVPITVNVSTLNLHDITLPDRLARRLAAAGMPAEQLCLEITETAASRDTARMMDILTRARLKGFQLAIDDFGTGYSSLKALRQLPFSVIKIDRSFVSDMTTSPDSRAIVKSIIGLAANMNMATIAEGVETEETAELLEHMNVDALQGYLIARSMPVEAIASWRTIWVAGGDTVGTGTDPDDGVTPANDHAMAVASGEARCLSPQQTEVMQLLTEGCSVKEIARRVGLPIGAVTIQLSHAYSVLGARDKTEAIIRAGLWPQQGAGQGLVPDGCGPNRSSMIASLPD